MKSSGSLADYEVNTAGCPVTVKLSNRQYVKLCFSLLRMHLLGLGRGVTAYHSRKRSFRSFTCLVEVRVAGDGVDVYRWWNGECTWLKFIQHVMKIPVGLLRMYVSSNSYCSEVYLFNSYLFMFYSEHERNCQYAPTQCPNSSQCPTLLKMVSPDRLQIQKQFGWRSNLARSFWYSNPEKISSYMDIPATQSKDTFWNFDRSKLHLPDTET